MRTRSLSPALVLCILLTSATSLRSQTVTVFRTLPDLTQALHQENPLHFSRAAAPGLEIVVDEQIRYQKIEGFGASLTDSSAWLLQKKLDNKQRSAAMRSLFDPKSGIGLSFLRQPLGASDFALQHYSFDDMPRGAKDPALQHFSIHHDEEYILPAIREALTLNPRIKVMLTPWSPPGWMKSKDSMIGGSLLDANLKSYAEYLVKSVESYQRAGVPIQYLSVQNEPLYETPDYPGTLMPAAQQLTLIRDHLGPAMERSGLRTQILAYDHNWDHPEYPMTILADPVASRYVAGTAFHCYGGGVEAQSTVHEKFPGKGIWETECSGGAWQKGNVLATTAQLTIRSMRNWARSVVLWNVALDQKNSPFAGGCSTCRGLITVDHSKQPVKVTQTVDYYALAQASKFARPGATRISSTDLGAESLETVAFQNENRSIALLVLNNSAANSTLHVRQHGKGFSYILPPGAIVTFIWQQR